MNYQPLFDVMSQHGLTLLESQMDEIVNVVNEMQPELKVCTGCGRKSTDPIDKKHLACCPDSDYVTLDDYLVNSVYRPISSQQFTALGSTTMNPPTKPEPSRLEVAERVLIAYISSPTFTGGSPKFLAEFAGIIADELIKQAKG